MEGVVTTKSMPIDQAFWADRRVLITGHTGFKVLAVLWLLELGACHWYWPPDHHLSVSSVEAGSASMSSYG